MTVFGWAAVVAAVGPRAAWAGAADAASPFLKRHCLDCHSGESAEAGLDLATLRLDAGRPESIAAWVRLHDRVGAGEMPPPADAAAPPAAEREAFLADLSATLTAADSARQRTQGRTVLRRLNRVEYENTLRDLLELPHLEIKQMLPADAEADGFDNVAAALRVSHVHMARHLDAAEAALSQAARLAPRPQAFNIRRDFTDIRRYQITKDLVVMDGLAVLLRQPNTAQTPWRIDDFAAPFPGEHRIRGRGVTYRQAGPGLGELDPPSRPHVLSVYADTRLLGSFDLTGEAAVHEVVGFLHAGERLTLLAPTLDDRSPKLDKGPYTGPAVALEWIEVEGPGDLTWPSASYRTLFGDLPVVEWTAASGVDPPPAVGEVKRPKDFPRIDLPNKTARFMVASSDPRGDARRLLARFLDRAFRKPAPAGEVERYMALVEDRLDQRACFHEALLTGYAAALCSPDFLYLDEAPGPLDDHALASRLSYFLRRSMPDERLRSLADRGELHKEAMYRGEVERLLADPAARRLLDDFAGQWLGLRGIATTQPDGQLYPEFDRLLLESMVAETRAYVQAMFDRDLPARSVVTGETAFVNAPLARLYGLPDVEGVAIREVPLPADGVRGGLLTQASVLKLTANGTTTSPVTRGAWVLDRVLGTPAPPPPPNVPAIEPDVRGTTTVRELLERHRADAACAGCHARIDPPGFALESFDVIGGWRDRYRSLDAGEPVKATERDRPVRYRLGPAVDPAGAAESGERFDDVRGFRALLLRDERQIARNLARRLLTYATGAGIGFADRAAVEAILDAAEPTGYGFRTLIREAALSETFRNK